VPARIVLVHSDSDFNIAATVALTVAGYDVASFSDPVMALDSLDTARTVEVLITRMRFGPDKPNGFVLARTARRMRPDIRVLFTAQAEFAQFAAGLGDFIAAPITPTDLVEGVRRLLAVSDFRPC
jgi:DNA-binding NtrC family response regulator